MLQKVVRSTVIDAPIERVWAVLRDFNSHDQWHDVVDSSRIEHGQASSQVGCVRSFSLKDGNRIRERLLALSDYDYACTYAILESPMGVDNYVATLELTPVTDGTRTFIEWHAEFDCAEGREAALVQLIGQGVFQTGFDALKRHFGNRR